MMSNIEFEKEMERWKLDSFRGGAISHELLQKTLLEQNLEIMRKGEIAWQQHLRQNLIWQGENKKEEEDFFQRSLDD